MSTRHTFLCTALIAAASCTLAQTLPQVATQKADEFKRQQERTDALRQKLEAAPDVMGAAPKTSAQTLPQDESPCFLIEQVELRNSAPEESRLIDIASAALAGPQKNDSPLRKCVGAQGISLLIQRAQDALVAQGFVTSRVLAPPQDLSGGNLILQIVAGRINAIGFDPAKEATDQPVRATTVNTVPTAAGQVLNLRDLEQGLENFKRVPTAEADIQIVPAPAGAPDQSDLRISRTQAFPVRFTATLDDSGSKSSGKVQGSATLSLDNPLGLSDLFYVTLSHDLSGMDTRAGNDASNSGDHGTRGNTVHYDLPLGYWLLGATYSFSTYYQSVAGASQTYTYSGTSDTSDIKLSRIVWRNASAKTTLGLKAWQRKSNNYIDDTEVAVQRRVVGGWEVSAGHKHFVGDSTFEASLSYKRGTGDFDTIAAPEELFGEGNSRFGLAVLDATATVPFALGATQLRYSGTLKVQDNFSPLTPQDRFAIGGRYTVRGFDGESSLSAERGWTLRNDLSLPLGKNGNDQGAHELYVGVDAGEVGGPSSTALLGNTLSGAVLGVRGAFKPEGALPKTAQLQYDLFVGGPLSKPAGFRTADTTAGFSLNLTF